MPISANISRPKLATTTTVPITLDIKEATLSGNKVNLPVVLTDLGVDPFTITGCTTTSGTATVSKAVDAFKSVRPGDSVTGTGIPANTKVLSVTVNGSSIVLTANASETGTPDLTFTQPPVDATLYILSIDHIVNGSQLRIVPRLYQFDGTQVKDTGSGSDDASITSPNANLVDLNASTLNLDDYLSKARKPRSNS